jgi:hypothetical protein
MAKAKANAKRAKASPEVDKIVRAFVQAIQDVIEAKTAERVQRIMREVLR